MDIEQLARKLLGIGDWHKETWSSLEGRLVSIGQAEGRLYPPDSPIACRNIARVHNLPLSEVVAMLKREADKNQ